MTFYLNFYSKPQSLNGRNSLSVKSSKKIKLSVFSAICIFSGWSATFAQTIQKAYDGVKARF